MNFCVLSIFPMLMIFICLRPRQLIYQYVQPPSHQFRQFTRPSHSITPVPLRIHVWLLLTKWAQHAPLRGHIWGPKGGIHCKGVCRIWPFLTFPSSLRPQNSTFLLANKNTCARICRTPPSYVLYGRPWWGWNQSRTLTVQTAASPSCHIMHLKFSLFLCLVLSNS